MAIGARVTDVGEQQLGVTLRTGDACVHAAQWITRLVMIEFGQIADWLPRRECMAVLARVRQISVRALRFGARNGLLLLR